MTPPSVFTIPAGSAFCDLLAAGLLEETKTDPLTLSSMLILLPTRRACRALAEAFLRQSSGRPLLLPALQPLGDAEDEDVGLGTIFEMPPAISPLTRQLQLARLILSLGGRRGGHPPTAEQATRLAAELGSLLDQVTTEGLDFSRLAELVPDDLARHWQITLDFLKIVTEHWPAILAEQGCIDAADRRNRLLAAQADAWQKSPPSFPVLAAGSTGSLPATAKLLAVIARMPKGRLVLPGLDRTLSPEDQAALDHTHPQSSLMNLLARLELAPATIPLWVNCRDGGARVQLLAEAMRPASTTDHWRHLSTIWPPTLIDTALEGVQRLECPGPREEAGAIALMMRDVLETPGRTAALVTADRGLARRVSAELNRYDIDIDDSAGRSLDLTPVGAFLSLTARMVGSSFAPHATLAALKHPLALGRLPAGHLAEKIRQIELLALRGPRPAPGIEGLLATLGDSPQLTLWLESLKSVSQPLATLLSAPDAPLSALLEAHLQLAEFLAADPEDAAGDRLWQGEAGQVASGFIADLAQAALHFPPMSGVGYPGLLHHLMAQTVVRPSWGRHPRLAIWGPLEARLQQADLLILGGLNEGIWPPEPAADPWMSRPMRQRFGLPPPERRVGLAAHDFVQAMSAPKVVLTRSLRQDGTPTQPSRWLLRLDAVLEALGRPRIWQEGNWLAWQSQLDRPAVLIKPEAPAPTPPLSARPRQLSATQIETWMRDPYAIYAQKILGLKVLDPIDADPGAADYGSIVHAALEQFVKAHPRGALPEDARALLLATGRQVFAPLLVRPGLAAFWWPRFESSADWFLAQEQARRPLLRESKTEITGRLVLPGTDFTLTAKADRLDLLANGTLAILDYKTGKPPSAKEVMAGFAPQLPLEAAIALAGGFTGVACQPIGELLYWRLGTGPDGGEETRVGAEDPTGLAESALAGLTRLVLLFDDPQTPYRARPHPEMAPRYSDYQHLARVKEWASDEDGDE